MKIKFQEEDHGIKTVPHKSLAELLIGRTVVMDDDNSFMIKYVSDDTVTLEKVSCTDACVRLSRKYKADATLEKIHNNTLAEVFSDISDLIDIIHIMKVSEQRSVVKQLYSKYGSNEAIPMDERLLTIGTLILALLDQRAANLRKARSEAEELLKKSITDGRIQLDSSCVCGYKGTCKVKSITLVPDGFLKVYADCLGCHREITVERILK